jgi:hypothetical protein
MILLFLLSHQCSVISTHIQFLTYFLEMKKRVYCRQDKSVNTEVDISVKRFDTAADM